MTGQKGKNSLSGMNVTQAMRRHFSQLPQDTPISHSINTLIKYKVSSILTTDDDGVPVGVLSKTDIMGAYYAELPIDSPLSFIMSSPPLFCKPTDLLDQALLQMKDSKVYRLYVRDEEQEVIGMLAYPDIVGLLYRFCSTCEYSIYNRNKVGKQVKHQVVRNCMSREVCTITPVETLQQAMELLSANRIGALPVIDASGRGIGVISKTDLILAFKHGLSSDEKVQSIMTSPPKSCRADDLLEDAIRTMIFSDIHRLFVCEEIDEPFIGVFSLTDAARNKSGSCHACISSRLTLGSELHA